MGKSDTTDNGQAAELPPENIDAALVVRIAAGDRQAETALVRRYSRAVRALLEQRVRSRETASDLVQETFIVVIARIRDSGIHDPSRIAGFLRQTAINLANSEKRKAQRQRTDVAVDEEIVESIPGPVDPQALVEEEDLARLVNQLVDTLPMERDRDLLRRYLVQGEDKDVLCSAYALSSEHFDRVLYRARMRLRELVEHRLSGELREEPK